MKPEALRNILRRRQESLPNADLVELENNSAVEGKDVHVVTSELRLERFTPGADMEALIVESPDFDHATTKVLGTLEPARMEHMGDIIWKAFRKKSVPVKAVELVKDVKRFMTKYIPTDSLWVGEYAIIYRFSDIMTTRGTARFRAIIEAGHFNGGIKRFVTAT